MKTFKILTVTILFLMLSAKMNASIMNTESVPAIIFEERNHIVKTINRNGVFIPVVDLPVVEITGSKSTSGISGTVKVNGIQRVVVTLPEVEISSVLPGKKQVRALNNNGEVVAVITLPVINISSEFPVSKLVNVVEYNNNLIPVVNLPEIHIISASSEILVSVRFAENQLLPQVNLPEIEISSYKSWVFNDIENEFTFKNDDLEWIYISLKNCGITNENKIICEVSTPKNLKPNMTTFSDLIRIN